MIFTIIITKLQYIKTNTITQYSKTMELLNYAKTQFEILKQTTPDAIIKDFEPEILNLIIKFEAQQHSGGSASYAIPMLAHAIKSLLSFEPINPVTEEGFELVHENTYQHKHLSALFMDENERKPYYIEAVIFQQEEDPNIAFTSSGTVYQEEIKNNKIPEIIASRQYVKSPFNPKRFNITVKKKNAQNDN